MNAKCESCGSPVVTALQPSGFVEHHREGGLDCVRTQLAQSKAREKRPWEPEIAVRPDPDVPGYAEMWVNGYCVVDQMIWTEAEALAERLRKALAVKPQAPSVVEGPKALSEVEGGGGGMSPKRIQRKRTRGWRMPPGAVYVGRPGFWGNPFRGPKAMRLYRLLWRRRWADLRRAGYNDWHITFLRGYLCAWKACLHELCGFDLACWCPPDRPCHADVLLRRANT